MKHDLRGISLLIPSMKLLFVALMLISVTMSNIMHQILSGPPDPEKELEAITQPSDDDMWIVARIPSKSKIISDYGNFLEDEKDKDDGKVWDELNSVFKEIKAAPMSPETR